MAHIYLFVLAFFVIPTRPTNLLCHAAKFPYPLQPYAVYAILGVLGWGGLRNQLDYVKNINFLTIKVEKKMLFFYSLFALHKSTHTHILIFILIPHTYIFLVQG